MFELYTLDVSLLKRLIKNTSFLVSEKLTQTCTWIYRKRLISFQWINRFYTTRTFNGRTPLVKKLNGINWCWRCYLWTSVVFADLCDVNMVEWNGHFPSTRAKLIMIWKYFITQRKWQSHMNCSPITREKLLSKNYNTAGIQLGQKQWLQMARHLSKYHNKQIFWHKSTCLRNSPRIALNRKGENTWLLVVFWIG